MKKRSIIWLIVVVVVVTGVIWYSNQRVETASVEPKVVKIGVAALLTGTHAVYGENVQDGVMLAVNEINEGGGIKGKAVEVVVEDEGSDPKQAVAAVQRLIAIEKVPVIIGPASSGGVMAAAPVANARNVVLLSPGGASPNITQAGDFVFRNRASGSAESLVMAEHAYNVLGIRDIAILQITTDYGEGFRKVFEDRFKELGGKVAAVEYFDAGTTDFRAQITKLKNLGVKAVFILGVPKEVGSFLKQAKELGFSATFISNNMESQDLLTAAGDAAEGLQFAIPEFNPQSEIPHIREFTDKFKSRYDRLPDMFAANGYDAMYIVKRAIEVGGYSGEGIRDALYAMKDFSVVNGGKISFDENGDVFKPLTIKEVRNGEFAEVAK
ncbi:MAG: ABC transporter substrate-binding protein [Candidatus Eisenbacteria bacterium]|uniref:ABC transporter substrate-binding protein n=1 Tax=Eiseniibacteriota bacterium TaxID=2212470 RepID=A0A948RWK6_UNCEI|nr:ABC transporter substrate-binding protein [Candidatus Eisenbacteria bacterium]MBU1950704.1 ABC transporter substrate-binding protein [Candidatus Eisenbacteria bacterium]MBU2690883.1 ABC transporter substrate-binding protein [Candidatus Eisenbacteria bacterium]